VKVLFQSDKYLRRKTLKPERGALKKYREAKEGGL
jgi:hypothetical protein